MKTTTDRIFDLRDDPEELEGLYREDPQAFRDSLGETLRLAPDSIALRVWRARLDSAAPAGGAVHGRQLWYALGICVAVGSLVRFPGIWLGEEWYYARFGPMWIFLGLAAYFLTRRPDRSLLIAGVSLTIVIVGYISFLPGQTDSVVMALIHLPLLMWAYAGVVFGGDSWRDSRSRVLFVRYNGELVVLTTLVGLGGMVLSGVTIALFAVSGIEMEEWYFSNVGLFCAAAVPVAATYLYDVVFNRRTAIAGVLARVFAPLFLLMVVIYLIVTLVQGANPFIDRSFLITFNGLLLLVLVISVFSLVERDGESAVGPLDYINVALVGVTLLIDAVALSAIVFRLAAYGFTPNRVTVLGANLIVGVHLVWIFWTYVGLVRHKVGFEAIPRVVGSYLPVYVAWAAVVAFVLPVVFTFG